MPRPVKWRKVAETAEMAEPTRCRPPDAGVEQDEAGGMRRGEGMESAWAEDSPQIRDGPEQRVAFTGSAEGLGAAGFAGGEIQERGVVKADVRVRPEDLAV